MRSHTNFRFSRTAPLQKPNPSAFSYSYFTFLCTRLLWFFISSPCFVRGCQKIVSPCISKACQPKTQLEKENIRHIVTFRTTKKNKIEWILWCFSFRPSGDEPLHTFFWRRRQHAAEHMHSSIVTKVGKRNSLVFSESAESQAVFNVMCWAIHISYSYAFE